MKTTALLIIIAAAIAAGVWYATRERPIDVRTVTVARGDVRATVSNTRVGTVKACRRARMSPSAPGQVALLNVAEGDRVEADAVLLEIWNHDRKAELRLAETEVDAARARADQACAVAAGARREADRVARLRTRQLIAEEIADRAQVEADSATAACSAARASSRVGTARVAVARAALERTVLRAPFAGVIAAVDAKLGEYLTPSPPGIPTLPAIDLIDPRCVYISAPIDEVDAPRIEAGMPACVTLDAFPDRYCDAEVQRIAPYVLEREKQARTVDVEVTLKNVADSARLLPGYSADIEVMLETRRDVIRVPSEAVIEGRRVLLIDDASQRLVEREFSPGLANWEYTEVKRGLEPGSRVVVAVGRAGVKAGALVRAEADTVE